MFGSHVGRANADYGAGLLAAGELAALRAAFAGCDVNARGGVFKQTALAFVGCPDALSRWLVERGTDLSAGDAYGETPLHARAGHWQGDLALLIELGADVNHAAGGRGTPLHRAAAAGKAPPPGCASWRWTGWRSTPCRSRYRDRPIADNGHQPRC